MQELVKAYCPPEVASVLLICPKSTIQATGHKIYAEVQDGVNEAEQAEVVNRMEKKCQVEAKKQHSRIHYYVNDQGQHALGFVYRHPVGLT
jgi:hypothetical protein